MKFRAKLKTGYDLQLSIAVWRVDSAQRFGGSKERKKRKGCAPRRCPTGIDLHLRQVRVTEEVMQIADGETAVVRPIPPCS